MFLQFYIFYILLQETCSAVYCYSPFQLDAISRTCVEHIEPIDKRMSFYIPLRVLSNVPLMYSKHFTKLYDLINMFSYRVIKTMELCEFIRFMTVNITYTDFKTFSLFPSDHDAEVIDQAMTVIISVDPSDTKDEPNTTPAKILNDLYKKLSFTWSKRSEKEGRTLDDDAKIEGFIDENGSADEIVLRTIIYHKTDSWLQLPPITTFNIDPYVADVMRSVRIGREPLNGLNVVYTSKDVYRKKVIFSQMLFRDNPSPCRNKQADLDFMKCPTFLYDVEQLSFNQSNDGIKYVDTMGNKATLGFDQFKTYNMTHVHVCVDAMRPTNDDSTSTIDVSTSTNDASTPANDASTPTNDASTKANDAFRPTNDVSKPTIDPSRQTDDVSRTTSDDTRLTPSGQSSSVASINNMDFVSNVIIFLLGLYIYFA